MTYFSDRIDIHHISRENLRADHFDAFFQAQMDPLVSLVAGSMGKPVVQDHGDNETATEITDDPEVESDEEQREIV
jgi:hypothetical protein